MSTQIKDADQYISQFEALVPELNDVWSGFRDEVFKEGLISARDKQLIALACAYMTGSEHDIRERTLLSKELGATDEQIAESVYIAIRLAIGQPYSCGERADREVTYIISTPFRRSQPLLIRSIPAFLLSL